MADRTRMTLLAVLIATVLLSALALGISSVTAKVDALRVQIAEYEGQISRVERAADSPGGASAAPAAPLSELESRIESEQSRYLAPRETSLSRFAEQIQNELTSAGLTVLRYRPAGEDTAGVPSFTSGGGSVEFVIRGGAESFLEFIRRSEGASHYRFITALSIRSGGPPGRIDANFRIGYEEKAVEQDQ
ncbi:hypothetical protein [Salinispira pacifica]